MSFDDIRDAREASQYLRQLRSGALSHQAKIDDARDLWRQWKPDAWVAVFAGWIFHDAVKDELAKDTPRFSNVLYYLRAMTRLLQAMGDLGEEYFIPCVARHYRHAVRQLADSNSAHEDDWAQLADRGLRLLDLLQPHLSQERNETEDGQEYDSDHDLFLGALRKCLKQAEHWAQLASLCEDVVTGQLPVDTPRWFGHSLLDSLIHGAPTSPERVSVCDDFIQRHGDNEHIQRAIALLRCEEERWVEAEEAFRRAIALSNTPWPWQDYARFVLDRDAAEAQQSALDLFLGGLARLDPDKPGSSWALHLGAALVLAESGNVEDAATELWLAREVRAYEGWPVGKEVEDALYSLAPALRDAGVKLLEEVDVHAVLESRRPVYRQARNMALSSFAEPHVVCDVRPDQRIAFARPKDGAYDRAIIKGGRLFKACPDEGSDILAIAVPSWDSRRERPSWRIAWLGKESVG